MKPPSPSTFDALPCPTPPRDFALAAGFSAWCCTDPTRWAAIIGHHGSFADQHLEVPWRSSRGMRHRAARGDFDVNPGVVSKTARTVPPKRLKKPPGILVDARGAAGDNPTA